MSELHYWPDSGQPGEYTVELKNGSTLEWYWNGDLWTRGGMVRRKEHMTEHGYLGVRREPSVTDMEPAPMHIEDDPQFAALKEMIREAIAEFRATVKQPTQAADLAFKWFNRFIEAVGK